MRNGIARRLIQLEQFLSRHALSGQAAVCLTLTPDQERMRLQAVMEDAFTRGLVVETAQGFVMGAITPEADRAWATTLARVLTQTRGQ